MDKYLIWCAGFFDGEGSICIPYGKRKGRVGTAAGQYWLQVNVTQNQRAPLDALKQRFGGRVNVLSQPPDKKLTRPIWRWTIDADKAAAFLREVRPFLRIKGVVADIGLEFQEKMIRKDGKKHTRWTIGDHSVVFARRAEIKARMEQANREGHAI